MYTSVHHMYVSTYMAATEKEKSPTKMQIEIQFLIYNKACRPVMLVKFVSCTKPIFVSTDARLGGVFASRFDRHRLVAYRVIFFLKCLSH